MKAFELKPISKYENLLDDYEDVFSYEKKEPEYRVAKEADIHPSIIEGINKKFNLFVSGGGGTGKTRFVNEIRQHIHPDLNLVVTATTGVAALNAKGCTLHSYSGLGIHKRPAAIHTIKSKRNWPYIVDRLNLVDILVVDECGMLSGSQMELVDQIFRDARNEREKPFGGLQVILCGDFLQLPPVVKKGEVEEKVWAFESDVWKSGTFKPVLLKKIWRQADPVFIGLLNDLRMGRVTKESYEILRSRCVLGDVEYKGAKPTRFVATKAEAERIHEKILKEWEGEPFISTANIKVKDCFKKFEDEIKEETVDACNADAILTVKPHMQVMMLVNDLDGRFVNGSLATFKGMEGKEAVIEIKATEQEIRVVPHTWEHMASDDTVKSTFTQYPFKLAFASTIHKAQGLTLDCVDVDLGRVFEKGQAYVAISRVKSLEGLFLRNLKLEKLKMVHEKAMHFYEELEKRGQRLKPVS